MRVVGLTGGIASGKSTISEYLESLGAIIVSADQIARDVVVPGEPAWQDIVDYFGKEMLLENQELDRKKLGDYIFKNPEERRKLNQIMHPRIEDLLEETIQKYIEEDKAPLIVLDIPLLIESGMEDRVNEVWVVAVNPETQLERLMERDKITIDQAMDRIRSQMPLEEKLKHADRVIDNNGTVEQAKAQVDLLWKYSVEK